MSDPAPEAEDIFKIPKMSDTELLDWVISELQAEKKRSGRNQQCPATAVRH